MKGEKNETQTLRDIRKRWVKGPPSSTSGMRGAGCTGDFFFCFRLSSPPESRFLTLRINTPYISPSVKPIPVSV